MFKLSVITLVFQVLSALLVLLIKRDSKTGFLFYLRLILVFTASVELIGFVLRNEGLNPFYIYFVFTGVVFVLITLMYYGVIFFRKKLIILKTLSFFLIAVWIVTFFYPVIFPNLIIFGSFNTSLFSFLYLRQLLLSNEIMNYKKLLPFWVSVGFLIFYLPSIPFFTLLDYMKNRGLFFILHLLIILMNLFIIYGLLCSKKEKGC